MLLNALSINRLLGPHLLIVAEHAVVLLFSGLTVGSECAIPEGEILTIVVVEVQMMDRVMSAGVNNLGTKHVVAIMNHDCPDVDEHENGDIEPLLHGNNVDKQVVWNRLSISIERMESMGSERGRDDPFVMGLVETLVKNRVVEPTMNPVDTKIGEHKEGSDTEKHIGDTSISLGVTVKLGITLDFTPEPWDSEQNEAWNSLDSTIDFETDLVLQELWMLHDFMVEQEEIGKGSSRQIEEPSAESDKYEDAQSDSDVVVARQCGSDGYAGSCIGQNGCWENLCVNGIKHKWVQNFQYGIHL